MRSLLRDGVLVSVIAVVVLFTNLGGSRLWDRDEPRNAGCAREMLQRNDWVTPVFNAQLRTHKPVLTYWFMMSAYTVLGVNEFAARFWSAALAVGTVLCTYAMGRRLFNAAVGVWAAIILSTCLMFDVAARAATPDSPLLFFATLALTVYVYAAFPAANANSPAPQTGWYPKSWWVVALIYALMGVAVLAKGPVGLVLPTAIIGMYLLIQRSRPADTAPARLPSWLWKFLSPLRVFAPLHFLRTSWFMRPGLALAACLVVALPWYIWVGLRTEGAFLEGFFLEHNFGRATQAMEGHSGPIVYYPIAILVGFFPWSVFAVPVILEVVRRIRRRDVWANGYIFACCWVCVYVGAFTLARTKLPSYVTPCYPALALLAGCFVYHWSEKTVLVGRIWPRLAMLAYCLVGLVLVVALPSVIHENLPGDEWLAAFGLIPAVGSAVCWILFERARARAAAVAFTVSATTFVMAMFVVAAGQVDQHQRNHVLLQAIEDQGGQVTVASYRCLEPTWVFYGGRPINELTAKKNWVERNGSWIPEPKIDVEDFLQQSPNACVITTDEHLAELRKLVPEHFGVLAQAPYFLRNSQLVVVGSTDASERTARTAPATGHRR